MSSVFYRRCKRNTNEIT